MSKLLFLSPGFMPGGAERVILRLLREMGAPSSEVHLAVLWGEGPLKTEVSPRTIVHNLGCKRARYALPGVVRAIRKVKPDIVLSTLSRLNVLLLGARALLPKNTRIIVREANTPSEELGHLPGGKLYPYLYRLLYPGADAIVCQSDFMRQDLINNFGIPHAKIARIYNPVPFDIIDRGAGAVTPFPTGLNFVSAGKMDYQKGFDLLIKSFALVADRLPEAKLTLVGDGDLLPELRALAAELGVEDRVAFPGFKANPYPWFKQADVFVSSSRYEGLPNVVLEALACGTPVLATNCPGGTSEIVTCNVNGWLIPTEDVSAMAEGILLAAREADRFERLAVRSSVQRFSSGAIAREYLDLFDQLLAT